MLHLSKVPDCDAGRGRESADEAGPLARAIQLGLLVYLSPVILLVSSIGVASLAVRAVTRLARGPRPIGVIPARRAGGRVGSGPGSARSRWFSTAH